MHVKIVHCPPRATEGADQGVGAHKDYGSLTLLQQDEVGGLQVQREDGAWIDAVPLPDAFVCNIGEMLLPFFLGPRLDAVVVPLPLPPPYLLRPPQSANVCSRRVRVPPYAGLPSSPWRARAKPCLPRGAGAVLVFALAGGLEAGRRFVEGDRLFSHVANIGDVRSVVIHPASTAEGVDDLLTELETACEASEPALRVPAGSAVRCAGRKAGTDEARPVRARHHRREGHGVLRTGAAVR